MSGLYTTLGEALKKAGSKLAKPVVQKFEVSCHPQLIDHVPLDGPIEPCSQYKMNILFHLDGEELVQTSRPNAFNLLMPSSQEWQLSKATEGDHLRKDQMLRSSVLDIFGKNGIWFVSSLNQA